MCDDPEHHAFDKRLSIVELRLTHMDSVLTGQREIMDRLVVATSNNGREIARLNQRVEQSGDKVVSAIATHAAEESKDRTKHTRVILWTLVTTFTTLATVVLHQFLNVVP